MTVRAILPIQLRREGALFSLCKTNLGQTYKRVRGDMNAVVVTTL